MMRDHLKEVFNERLFDSNDKNYKLSTISPFNIKRILRVCLDIHGENESKELLNELEITLI